jgi:hypothetical protein
LTNLHTVASGRNNQHKLFVANVCGVNHALHGLAMVRTKFRSEVPLQVPPKLAHLPGCARQISYSPKLGCSADCSLPKIGSVTLLSRPAHRLTFNQTSAALEVTLPAGAPIKGMPYAMLIEGLQELGDAQSVHSTRGEAPIDRKVSCRYLAYTVRTAVPPQVK